MPGIAYACVAGRRNTIVLLVSLLLMQFGHAQNGPAQHIVNELTDRGGEEN